MSAKRSGQVFDKLPQGEHPVITYVVKGETKYIISKTDYGEPVWYLYEIQKGGKYKYKKQNKNPSKGPTAFPECYPDLYD